jgi:hypothetical protein
MSRDLYLSFSNNSLITADNTTDFAVTAYYFSGTTIALEDKFDSNAYLEYSDGYNLIFSAYTQNKVIWNIGLFDAQNNPSSDTEVASNEQLRSNGYYKTVNCGCGLVKVTANTGPCHTSAYGEVVNVTPDQNAEAYIHHDITQVTSLNALFSPALPSIVLKVFNSNYPTSVASGDTVTATLYVTGVTYVTGGTSIGETTTYTDTISLTHPGWGTLSAPEKNMTYDILPNVGVGIHRGMWRFQLQISTNNQSSGDHLLNKYAKAYFINNSCPIDPV